MGMKKKGRPFGDKAMQQHPCSCDRRSRLQVVSIMLLLFVLIAVASCHRTQQRQDDIRVSLSWAATTRMTAEAWTAGRIPRAYAGQTVRTAHEEMMRLIDSRQGERPEYLPHLEKLARSAEQIAEAIRKEDRGGLATELTALQQSQEVLARDAKK